MEAGQRDRSKAAKQKHDVSDEKEYEIKNDCEGIEEAAERTVEIQMVSASPVLQPE